jgi:hypothetical protein
MATRTPCVRTKLEEREMRQARLLTSAGFSCLDVFCLARVPPDVPSCFGFSIFFVWPSLRTTRATAFGVSGRVVCGEEVNTDGLPATSHWDCMHVRVCFA